MVVDLGPTYWINRSFGEPEKKFSLNFIKANTKFCLGLHYNDHESCLFVSGKEIITFKADNKNINFPTLFCLGSISDTCSANEPRKLSIKLKCIWILSRLHFYW